MFESLTIVRKSWGVEVGTDLRDISEFRGESTLSVGSGTFSSLGLLESFLVFVRSVNG